MRRLLGAPVSVAHFLIHCLPSGGMVSETLQPSPLAGELEYPAQNTAGNTKGTTYLDGQGNACCVLAGGGCCDAVVARRAAGDGGACIGDPLVLRKQRLHVVRRVGKRPAHHTHQPQSLTAFPLLSVVWCTTASLPGVLSLVHAFIYEKMRPQACQRE